MSHTGWNYVFKIITYKLEECFVYYIYIKINFLGRET